MSDAGSSISPRDYAIVADAYTRITEADANARESLCHEFRSQHPSLWEDLRLMLDADPSIAIAAVRVNHTEEDAALVGTKLRDWNLIGLVGKGGFGTVYLARRQAEPDRAYALKLLNRAMQTAEGRSRFRHELEAQRAMDHAFIPRVVDRGESEDGRPFVVMPFYAGLPVVTYSRKLRIPVRSRIELFLRICDAVAHAHLKGVIHRDLKPDNVLVAEGPDGPIPAIIDFGLAKAFDADDPGRTNITLEGQMLGTPEYMSPEQAVDSRSVDARSDQYSLGCILYEMLTGRPPLTTEEIRSQGRAAMHRIIAEKEPVSPHALAEDVPPEIGWICMRCLEKDPARRYPTMDALIKDLRAFLGGEAIEAAPPTRTYRVRKLVRKHRTAFFGIVATLCALIMGGAASVVFALHANSQRQRAEEINQFVRRIFTQVDPAMVRGRDPEQMLLMLDAAAEGWGVVNDPQVELELNDVFAQAYHAVGKLDQASVYMERAMSLVEELEGPDSRRMIQLLRVKVDVLRSQAIPSSETTDEWYRLIEIHYPDETLERLEEEFKVGTERYGSAWGGSFTEIFDLYDRTTRLVGPHHPLALKIRFQLALHDANNWNPACHRQIQEAREYAAGVLGPDHPMIHLTINSELWALANSPLSIDEKVEFCRRRIKESEMCVGPLSRDIIYAYYNMAYLEWEAGEYEAGIRSATVAHNRATRAQGTNSSIANWIDNILALNAVDSDNMEALALAEVRVRNGHNKGRMWQPLIRGLIGKLVNKGMLEHADAWIRAAGGESSEWEQTLRTEFNVPRGAQNAQPSN